MLTPYFDCSRTGQSNGVVVVSGWLSTVEQWERFATDWKLVLAKYDVPYFHMKEFAHSVEAFSRGWKGENNRRELFILALLGVIQDYVKASFSCMIERSVFAEVDEEYRVQEYFGNEFALCGRTCIAEVNKWSQAHNYDLTGEYVFEDGDEGKGTLSG